MRKHEISTLIKSNALYGNNMYIIGQITGIGYMISGKKSIGMSRIVKDGVLYTNKFTALEYDDFINIVEKLYPNLIETNIQFLHTHNKHSLL